jgi:hypothetical protein
VNTEKDVPPQYSDFNDVFSKEAAKHFPLERNNDHKINFTDDALKTFPCKIYPISKLETEFLCHRQVTVSLTLFGFFRFLSYLGE